MLELTELAQFLTDGLNEVGQNGDYKFLVYAEMGKSQPNTICGTIKTSEPTITPINGIKNIKYNSVVELVVSAPTANFNLKNVENIIGEFIENYNGQEIDFSKGKGLMTFTFTRAKDYKMDYAVGESIPITFGVMVNYTENMVTSATKHWQIREIDGEWLEIPYLSESVLLEKGGKTNNISDALYQQTLLTSQIKHYRFEIPYETNDSLCSMLQKDILQGDFGKKYELRYYDGVSFLQNDPFKTTVSIFSTGDSGSVRPDTAKLTVTFTDVDNGQNSIYYEMALVDDPFDTLSDNTQYFNSQQEQIDYFDELIAVGADYDEIPAPNLNSLNITNQVYLNTRKYDVFDLINKNHAIIKASYRDNSKTYYFHYKINNGDIGANGQVSFNLTLNTIQTYLFNPDLDIQGSFIQKSHLDRWIDNGNGTVTFNGKADSKLFEREEIKEVAKRLVSRAKLQMYTSKNTELCDWLNDYVDAWVYVVIDAGHKYKTKDSEEFKIDSTRFFRDIYSDESYSYSTACVCFPLYKYIQAQIRFASNTHSGEIKYWTQNSLIHFLNNNDNYSRVKCVKISLKPPFDLNSETIKYTIDTETILGSTLQYLTLTTSSTSVTGLYSLSDININNTWFSPATSYGLLIYDKDYLNPIKLKTTLTIPKNTFNKDDVTGVNGVGVNKNKKFNPKLNCSDYKSLVLTFAGATYEMDLQKINQDSVIEFEYIEMITADITKGLCRFKSSSNNDIFSLDYSKSFNGFIFTNDLSLPISNGQLDSYLANNKNAFLSFQNQQTLASTQYAIRSANNITNLVKDPVNLINGTQQILTDTVSTTVNIAYNQAQFDLSIDNMRNAPQTLMNANGNVSFLCAVSDFGIYAELYEGLDTELEMANDIMFRDGYNYNRFDDLRSQLNIRRYFNYVKAVIGSLSGIPMSEESRKDFKQRFANGLRFWNKNEQNKFVIDYTKENYENRLV